MLQRILSKLAQRVLQKYFVVHADQTHEDDESDDEEPTHDAVPPTSTPASLLGTWWSSSSSNNNNNNNNNASYSHLEWDNLSLRSTVLQETLGTRFPLRLVHGHVRHIRMGVASSDTIHLTLEGVSLLLAVDASYDTPALQTARAKTRRKHLRLAQESLVQCFGEASTEPVSWRDSVRARLKEGLLPALADRVQIHVRNLHIRMEDTQANSPYAMGVVWRSMHVQNRRMESAAEQGLIHKDADWKDLGVYCNALDDQGQQGWEHAILQHLPLAKAIKALQRTVVARVDHRTTHSPTSHGTALTHTYLLLPMDGSLQATLAAGSRSHPTPPQPMPNTNTASEDKDVTVSQAMPVVQVRCHIPEVHGQLRDFQCLQIHGLWHCYKEYKYGLHYRHLRPIESCLENPRAYWHYACNVIRYQLKEHKLRWCRGRLFRGLLLRRRYCDLYERKLRAQGVSPDDAAGGNGVRLPATQNGAPNSGLEGAPANCAPLSDEEQKELQAMEDGLIGDLSIEDIILFRILVERRIGAAPVAMAAVAEPGQPNGWLSRSNSSSQPNLADENASNEEMEDETEREYQRLVAYWHDMTAGDTSLQELEAQSLVMVSWSFNVESGKMALFSPLNSTSDQVELRRLQQRYLVFHFDGFTTDFKLMKDLKSMSIQVTLQDFVATETRSDQIEHPVIRRDQERIHFFSRNVLDSHDYEVSAHPPLLSFLFTKNPPSEGDIDMAIQARLHPLRVILVPGCEWIRCTKSLIRPLPQYRKASNFWNDLSMARINSWASTRLSLLAKATSAAEHSNIDLFIDADCPILQISDGRSSELVFDFGRALLRTKKLASVSDAMMLFMQAEDDPKTPTVASCRFDQESFAASREDGSVLMPIRYRRGMTQWRKASSAKSVLGSVRFDESVKLDSFGEYIKQADMFHESAEDRSSFFYDTYELEYAIGGVNLLCEDGREDLIMPTDVRITIHRSILPSDHTLAKLKIRCSVEEFAVSVFDTHFRLFFELMNTWKQVFSSEVPLTHALSLDPCIRGPLLAVDSSDPFECEDDTMTDSSTSFDENEFFDATDTFGNVSEKSAEEARQNDWTAESSSLIDEEMRHFSRSSRRRHRSGSALSEVSSISDSSFVRPKDPVGPSYLSAENLAKLVEEDAGDESSEADGSEDDSFHSVVSLNQLHILEKDLLQDIKDAELCLGALRSRLSELRRMGTSTDAELLKKQKQKARLEMDRTIAELKTLRAAHCDIVAQVRLLECVADSERESSMDFIKWSLRRATNILELRKRKDEKSLAASGHNLTRGLKRNLIEVSLALNRATVQIGLSESDAFSESMFVIGITDVALLLHKSLGESKYLARIESMDGGFRTDSSSAISEKTFFIGGSHDYIFSNALPARYPQCFSALTMGDKLLQFVAGVRESPSQGNQSTKLIKISLSIGDIELIPHEVVFHSFIRLASTFSVGRKVGAIQNEQWRANLRARLTSKEDHPSHLDLAVRTSAFRVHILDEVIAGALALNNLRVRYAKSATSQLFKARSQLDVSCKSLQLICFRGSHSDTAVEVFGLKDPDAALLDLRLRRQLVPTTIAGGWVLGEETAGDSQEIAGSECWNIHVGAQIEGFVMTLDSELPRLVKCMGRLVHTIKATKGELAKLRSERENKTHATSSRWRADFTLDESLFVIASNTEERSQEMAESQCLTFTLATNGSIHPSIHHENSLACRFALSNVSLRLFPEQFVVIEPFEARLKTEIPAAALATGKGLVYTNPPAWLDVNDSFFVEAVQLDESTLSLCCQVASVQVNVTPSSMSRLKKASKILKDMLNNLRDPEENYERVDKVQDDRKGDRKLLLVIARASVALYHEKRAVESVNRPQEAALLETYSVQLSIRTTRISTAVSFGIAGLIMIDPSSRSRFKIVSGGILPENGTGSVGSSLSNTDFILLTVAKKFSGLDRADVDLNIIFGDFAIVPLPHFVRNCMIFVHAYEAITGEESAPKSKKNEIASMHFSLRKLRRLAFCVSTGMVDLILPSMDLARHIDDRSVTVINAVKFKWKFCARGSVHVSILDQFTPMENLFARMDDRMAVEDAFMQFINQRVIGSSTALLSEMEANVDDFQVLRTYIERKPSPNNGFDFKGGRAQRVTNPTCFTLKHHLSGTFFPSDDGNGQDWTVSVVHALKLSAELLDVLVYISQSAGGMNDALRFTVKPLIQAIKHPQRANRTVNKSATDQASVADVLRDAPLILALRIEGIRLTCVPGGASILTEAPIVKFSLRQIQGGGAATTTLSPMNMKSSIIASHATRSGCQSEGSCLAGGWLRFQIAASYHNRRLVAWEPFVEPWQAEIITGLNLTKAFGFRVAKKVRLDMRDDQVVHQRPDHEIELGRFRGISRLLRSPFQSDAVSEMQESRVPSILSHDVDLCYLSLASSAVDIISGAMSPLLGSKEMSPFSLLPGSRPYNWLSQFGYPSETKLDPQHNFNPPTVACYVTDCGPLNINVTGALIENLSGYLGNSHGSDMRRISPHWIRNGTGLTIRFMEVLDVERQLLGEKAPKFTLSNNSQAPLTLRRSLSQSCDPHKSFILVELGSFEDTIDRVSIQNLENRTGSLTNTFAYRISAKIPLDTVGLHRFPLEWNRAMRSLSAEAAESAPGPIGWVIVRVALQGGIKLVTLESPMILKNIADTDLLCEVRDHDGISVVWRSLIRKQTDTFDGLLSIPVDLVSYLHSDSYLVSAIALPRASKFQDESELTDADRTQFTPLALPRPFSQLSFSKGVIEMRNKKFQIFNGNGGKPMESVHLNLCSLRIGSFDLDQSLGLKLDSTDLNEPMIPEGLMLLFRSTVAFYNHLAHPIQIQVKVPDSAAVRHRVEDRSLQETPTGNDWVNVGKIEGGKSLKWSGAAASSSIELRIKLITSTCNSECFPEWSTSAYVPLEDWTSVRSELSSPANIILDDLQIYDAAGLPLSVSAMLTRGFQTSDGKHFDDVNTFSESLACAGRVVQFYVPFWVIDNTGLDLQFRSEFLVAGQRMKLKLADPVPLRDLPSSDELQDLSSLGLAELLHGVNSISSPSSHDSSLNVIMIGSEGSSRLHVRRHQQGQAENRSRWSDAIPLSLDIGSYHDTTMHPSLSLERVKIARSTTNIDGAEQYHAIRSQFIRAPESFGGKLGTKLVHIFCRYQIVNETNRELEVMGQRRCSPPHLVAAECDPRPFHFDDTRPLRFRPREFGWHWSGLFNITPAKNEVTMRLRNELKSEFLIITVDVRPTEGESCIIVFRFAPPPYRIENHTVYPLEYHQSHSIFRRDGFLWSRNRVPKSIILPYHHAEFAWDQPEYGTRSLNLRLADVADQPADASQRILGVFDLDRVAPGSVLPTGVSSVFAQIDIDGATRVLRFSEQTQNSFSVAAEQPVTTVNALTQQAFVVSIKLSHGIGISLVDWTPQELVYARLEDIAVELTKLGIRDAGSVSIGCITLNNQLWVTPYPVMVRMGSRLARRKNRRHCAVSFSWSRRMGIIDLFDRIDLVSEPMTINIDGNLVLRLISLAKSAKEVRMFNDTAPLSNISISRDAILKSALHIRQYGLNSAGKHDPEKVAVDELHSYLKNTATIAISSKLRSDYRPLPRHESSKSTVNGELDVMSPRRKFYVDRLRISAVTAKISWSGLLPVASSFPRILRPALTFENLPLFLGPFSGANFFGTSDEQVNAVRSHYLNFRRIIDICAGVVTNPTFLLRACMFTWREIVATGIELIADGLQYSGTILADSAERAWPDLSWSSSIYVVGFLQRSMKHGASFFEKLSSIAASSSSLLRYKASQSQVNGQLVRSRNPRLFSTIDGHHDLLVEYVEGVNSGKALLSRVRAGCYLGEGYVYHVDGVRIPHTGSGQQKSQLDLASSLPGLLLVTRERIILLNGQLTTNFCDELWNLRFDDMVMLETGEVTTTHSIVRFWCTSEKESPARDDSSSIACRGLDILQSISVVMPTIACQQFLTAVSSARGIPTILQDNL